MYSTRRSQTTCRPADVPGVFIFLDGQKDPLRNRASGMPFFNHTKGAAERPCRIFVLDEGFAGCARLDEGYASCALQDERLCRDKTATIRGFAHCGRPFRLPLQEADRYIRQMKEL